MKKTNERTTTWNCYFGERVALLMCLINFQFVVFRHKRTAEVKAEESKKTEEEEKSFEAERESEKEEGKERVGEGEEERKRKAPGRNSHGNGMARMK